MTNFQDNHQNTCPICGKSLCRLCPKGALSGILGAAPLESPAVPSACRAEADCYLLEIGPVFCLGRFHLTVRRVQWVWLWQIITRWVGVPCTVLALEVWQGEVWTQVTAAQIWDQAERTEQEALI